MPGIYRPRHPERTAFYRALFHNFDRFLAEYERRFEKEYGYFRPIVQEVVERYFDCGNPRSGFARIRCPDCHLDDARLAEIFAREVLALLVSKGLLSPEWAERILSWRHTGFNVHSHKFIARVPDKGQVMVRYYGLYANAHRGKVRKASGVPVALGMIEEEPKPITSKGWAEMIRKVYEVDPLVCPRCGGRMKVVAFLTEYAVVDRIIRHLELTFIAEKPPPAQAFEQVALPAAEIS